MRLWAAYSGEFDEVTAESGIAINDSLISRPLGASEIAQLVNLYSQGLLSKRTVLDELQRGGILDPDLKVQDEISRTDEDHQDQVDQMIDDETALQETVSSSSDSQVSNSSVNGDPTDDLETPEKAQSAASRAQ